MVEYLYKAPTLLYPLRNKPKPSISLSLYLSLSLSLDFFTSSTQAHFLDQKLSLLLLWVGINQSIKVISKWVTDSWK